MSKQKLTLWGFDLWARPKAFGCFYFFLLPYMCICLALCIIMFIILSNIAECDSDDENCLGVAFQLAFGMPFLAGAVLLAIPLIIIAVRCRRDKSGVGPLDESPRVCGFDVIRRPRVFGLSVYLLPSIMIVIGLTLFTFVVPFSILQGGSPNFLLIPLITLPVIFTAVLVPCIALCRVGRRRESPPKYDATGLDHMVEKGGAKSFDEKEKGGM